MNGVGSSFLLNSTVFLFFGNIYKITIDFNFLEKKMAFFLVQSVMTRFCFMAHYYKGVKQIPPCGLKWIF